MHAAIELLAFWLVAYLTLCLALVLTSVFGNVIESDMEFLSLGKESVLAGVASLIEATSVWLIVLFISPEYRGGALRAMIVPLIVVALVYKIAHFESWTVIECGLLLAFQVAIGCLIASLIAGHFFAAIMVVAVCGIILAIVANFAKNL